MKNTKTLLLIFFLFKAFIGFSQGCFEKISIKEDTSCFKYTSDSIQKAKLNKIRKIDYQINYMNPISMSIQLAENITYHKNHEKGYGKISLDSSCIEICLNQNFKLKKEVRLWKEIDTYEAFPIFIKNKCRKEINIGYLTYLPITLQVKNEKGIWKNVEFTFLYNCDIDPQFLKINQNEVFVTKALKYSGNYPALMRYKIANLYSKEFPGFIYKKFMTQLNRK